MPATLVVQACKCLHGVAWGMRALWWPMIRVFFWLTLWVISIPASIALATAEMQASMMMALREALPELLANVTAAWDARQAPAPAHRAGFAWGNAWHSQPALGVAGRPMHGDSAGAHASWEWRGVQAWLMDRALATAWSLAADTMLRHNGR